MRKLLCLCLTFTTFLSQLASAAEPNPDLQKYLFFEATHASLSFDEFAKAYFEPSDIAEIKSFLTANGYAEDKLGIINLYRTGKFTYRGKSIIITESTVKINGEYIKYDPSLSPAEQYKRIYKKIAGTGDPYSILSLVIPRALAKDSFDFNDPEYSLLEPGKDVALAEEAGEAGAAIDLGAAAAGVTVGGLALAGLVVAGVAGAGWGIKELWENHKHGTITCSDGNYVLRFKTRGTLNFPTSDTVRVTPQAMYRMLNAKPNNTELVDVTLPQSQSPNKTKNKSRKSSKNAKISKTKPAGAPSYALKPCKDDLVPKVQAAYGKAAEAIADAFQNRGTPTNDELIK